jgi:hypothetical protein
MAFEPEIVRLTDPEESWILLIVATVTVTVWLAVPYVWPTAAEEMSERDSEIVISAPNLIFVNSRFIISAFARPNIAALQKICKL